MTNHPLRLVPDYPLPPYAFLPGYRPHPERHPEGHMHDDDNDDDNIGEPSPLNPDQWWKNRHYLIGIDLFNYGYYWESHEKWEALWLKAEVETNAAFLKALIKLSAAGVKIRVGNKRGTISHAKSGKRLFTNVREKSGRQIFAGLNLLDLIEFCSWIRQKGDRIKCDPNKKVEKLFSFNLEPR